MQPKNSKPVNIDEQIKPVFSEVNISPTFQGWQVQGAPQEAMTAPNTDALTSSSGTSNHIDGTSENYQIIYNLRTRVNELEDALVKLNLIKSR